ncbi:NADP-dependent oxidoreductase [Mesorhizobium sp. BAC0120]|uniref:NADP-dependent oxidoreductase n=1 Tax=Mesorhizobium sp. BAC0120 TaxID=3090670 RepID=UPI00298D0033|nr:NADP-dependent oxidoreductase [Mesorhizobium sp. BAC0120]MDW6022217.1 NADP-dependent oxidoreductase [Mesorhizobium sp. BAC0120]
MRAVVQTKLGGPEVLEVVERPSPKPGAGQVLVRVKAAGINPVDVAVRTGAYPLLGEPPFTIGWDISGIVEEVGPGVEGVSVGEEVYGMPLFPKEAGAYAEQVVAPANELAPKPKSLDHVHAAAIPLAGLTAWLSLVRTAAIGQGQRVLIHGAGGGVGHLAVQIAKARGATVIATASAGKVDFVRSLGADVVIDYAKSDFVERAKEADVALETVGGDHAAQTVKALKPGGVLVSLLGVTDAAQAEGKARDVRIERISVRPDREGLVELARFADAGKLRPNVERTFPLDQAGAAHSFLATRPKGKVVLTV